MATITISPTGGNFNSTGTWVGGVLPLTTDDILGASTSGPLVVNVASTVLGANFTNYTNTLTMTSTLQVNGSGIQLGAGMTIAGDANLIIGATSTIRSNGKDWPNGIQVSLATLTITLFDNWNAGNLVCGQVSNGTQTFNGNNLYLMNGNAGFSTVTQILTCNSNSTNRIVAGSTNVHLMGSGNINCNTAGYFRLNTIINTSATLGMTAWGYSTGTITYTSGAFSGTGALVMQTNTTLNTDTLFWPNVQPQLATVLTLSSPLNVNFLGFFGTGNKTISGVNRLTGCTSLQIQSNTAGNVISIPNELNVLSGTTTFSNTVSNTINFRLNCFGNINASGGGGIATTGSGFIVAKGNGTISSVYGYKAGGFQNLLIDAVDGYSLAGNIRTNNLFWSGGTFDLTGRTIFNGGTITIDKPSPEILNGRIVFEPNTTNLFSNVDLTINNFQIGNEGETLNVTAQLSPVINHTITGEFRSEAIYNDVYTLQSSNAVIKTLFTLQSGSTQEVVHTNATRVNSLSGEKIYTYKGTLNSADNWFVVPNTGATATVSYPFVG
jgi:hypothetical protein